MSLENQEIIDAQYYVRELQVKAILEQTEERFMEDFAAKREAYQAIDHLLTTPPVISQMMLNSKTGLEEETYQKAASSAKIIAERAHVVNTLLRLARVTGAEVRGINEVAIEDQDLPVPEELRRAFSRHPELLTTAALEGREEAGKKILEIMQGDIPLLRLRLDLARRKELQLSPGLNGGLVGSLPTKVPKVDLRYFYPQDEQMPKLSLVVNPFE